MTSLNSMKHYMPCVPCRHNAKIKYDSNGNGYTEKFSFCDTCEVKMLFNKLKEYEDFEEQGLLLKLPCKVKDTVYAVYRTCKREDGVEIHCLYNEIEPKCKRECVKVVKDVEFRLSFLDGYFGNAVFLTREEAEAKLKELESE